MVDIMTTSKVNLSILVVIMNQDNLEIIFGWTRNMEIILKSGNLEIPMEKILDLDSMAILEGTDCGWRYPSTMELGELRKFWTDSMK